MGGGVKAIMGYADDNGKGEAPAEPKSVILHRTTKHTKSASVRSMDFGYEAEHA